MMDICIRNIIDGRRLEELKNSGVTKTIYIGANINNITIIPSHDGLIDRGMLWVYANNQKDKTIDANDVMRMPVIIPANKEPEWEEPDINPCRGCKDYDGKGGCLSNGGCGKQ